MKDQFKSSVVLAEGRALSISQRLRLSALFLVEGWEDDSLTFDFIRRKVPLHSLLPIKVNRSVGFEVSGDTQFYVDKAVEEISAEVFPEDDILTI